MSIFVLARINDISGYHPERAEGLIAVKGVDLQLICGFTRKWFSYGLNLYAYFFCVVNMKTTEKSQKTEAEGLGSGIPFSFQFNHTDLEVFSILLLNMKSSTQ